MDTKFDFFAPGPVATGMDTSATTASTVSHRVQQKSPAVVAGRKLAASKPVWGARTPPHSLTPTTTASSSQKTHRKSTTPAPATTPRTAPTSSAIRRSTQQQPQPLPTAGMRQPSPKPRRMGPHTSNPMHSMQSQDNPLFAAAAETTYDPGTYIHFVEPYARASRHIPVHTEADAETARRKKDASEGRIRLLRNQGKATLHQTSSEKQAAFVYARELPSVPPQIKSGALGSNVTILDLTASSVVNSHLPVLATCTNVSQLYLSHNEITSLDTLPSFQNLLVLIASHNQIGPDFSIPSLPALAACMLADNDIATWNGVCAMPRLHALDLRRNPLSYDDDVALAKARLSAGKEEDEMSSDYLRAACHLFGEMLENVNGIPVKQSSRDDAAALPPILAEITRSGFNDWAAIGRMPTEDALDACMKEMQRRQLPAAHGLFTSRVHVSKRPHVESVFDGTENHHYDDADNEGGGGGDDDAAQKHRVGSPVQISISFAGRSVAKCAVQWFRYLAHTGMVPIVNAPTSLDAMYVPTEHDVGAFLWATVDPLTHNGDRCLPKDSPPIIVTSETKVVAFKMNPKIVSLHFAMKRSDEKSSDETPVSHPLHADVQENWSFFDSTPERLVTSQSQMSDESEMFIEGTELQAHALVKWRGNEGRVEYQWRRRDPETLDVEDVTARAFRGRRKVHNSAKFKALAKTQAADTSFATDVSTYQLSLADVGYTIICVGLAYCPKCLKQSVEFVQEIGTVLPAQPGVESLEISRFRGDSTVDLEKKNIGQKTSAAREGDSITAQVVYCGGYRGECECSWERKALVGKGGAADSNWETIPESAGLMTHTVGADDVGCSVRFAFLPVRDDGVQGEMCYSEGIANNAAVKAKEPNVVDRVIVHPKSQREADEVAVYADYVGGYEGASHASVAFTSKPPPADRFLDWFSSLIIAENLDASPPPSYERMHALWTHGVLTTINEDDEDTSEENRTRRCTFTVPLEAVGKYVVVVYTPVRLDGREGQPVVVCSPDVVMPADPDVISIEVEANYEDDGADSTNPISSPAMSPGLQRYLMGVQQQEEHGSEERRKGIVTERGLAEGNTLTASYVYHGGIEGESRITWLRSLDESETSECDEIVAEGPSYVLSDADCGRRLVVEVVPVRNDGVEGPAVRHSVGNGMFVKPTLPRASGLRAWGNLTEGSIIRASWKYSGGREGNSRIVWKRMKLITNEDGTREEIAAGTVQETISVHGARSAILLTDREVDCRLVVRVTPVRDDGEEGDTVEYVVRSLTTARKITSNEDEDASIRAQLYIRPLLPEIFGVQVECYDAGKSSFVPACRLEHLSEDKRLRVLADAISIERAEESHLEDYVRTAHVTSEWLQIDSNGNTIQRLETNEHEELVISADLVGSILAISLQPWKLISYQRVDGPAMTMFSRLTDTGELVWIRELADCVTIKPGHPYGLKLSLPSEAPTEGFPIEPLEISYRGGKQGESKFAWFAVDTTAAASAQGGAEGIVRRYETSKFFQVASQRSLTPNIRCVHRSLVCRWTPVRDDGVEGTPLFADSPQACSPAAPRICFAVIERTERDRKDLSPGSPGFSPVLSPDSLSGSPSRNMPTTWPVLTVVHGHVGGLPGNATYQWIRLPPSDLKFPPALPPDKLTADAAAVYSSPLVGCLHSLKFFFQEHTGKPHSALAPIRPLVEDVVENDTGVLNEIAQTICAVTKKPLSEVVSQISKRFESLTADMQVPMSFVEFAGMLARISTEVAGAASKSKRAKRSLPARPITTMMSSAKLVSNATDSSYTCSRDDLGYKLACLVTPHRVDGEPGESMLCIFDAMIGKHTKVLTGVTISGNLSEGGRLECTVQESADSALRELSVPSTVGYEWSITDPSKENSAPLVLVSIEEGVSRITLDKSCVGMIVSVKACVLDARGRPAVGPGSSVSAITESTIRQAPPRTRTMSLREKSSGSFVNIVDQSLNFHHHCTVVADWHYEGGTEGDSVCHWLEREQITTNDLRVAVATVNAGAVRFVTPGAQKLAEYIGTGSSTLIALAMAKSADKAFDCMLDELMEYRKRRARGMSPISASHVHNIEDEVSNRFTCAIAGISDEEALQDEITANTLDLLAKEAKEAHEEGGPRMIALTTMIRRYTESTKAVVDWRTNDQLLLYSGNEYRLWVNSIGNEILCVHRPIRKDGVESTHALVTRSVSTVTTQPEIKGEVDELMRAASHKFECSLPARRGERFLLQVEKEKCKLARHSTGIFGIGGKLTEARSDYMDGFAIEPVRRLDIMLEVTLTDRQDASHTYSLDVGSLHRRDVAVLFGRGLAAAAARNVSRSRKLERNRSSRRMTHTRDTSRDQPMLSRSGSSAIAEMGEFTLMRRLSSKK